MPSLNSFRNNPTEQHQRSKFDLSHDSYGTMDAGLLVPVLHDWVMPGTTVNLETKIFARLLTLANPIFSNLYLDLFAFFVPHRLVWENFQRFMGEQASPDASIDFLVPKIIGVGGSGIVNQLTGTLWDYMVLPTDVDVVVSNADPLVSQSRISALPFRSYNLIFNDWFRSENLETSQAVPKGDGPDDISLFPMLHRAKRPDYFSAALPWPQKGPAVTIPIGTVAPVIGDGDAIGFKTDNVFPVYGVAYDMVTTDQSTIGYSTIAGPAGDIAVPANRVGGAYIGLHTDPTKSHVVADLSLATGININQFRQLIVLQQLLELYARGGTRYNEIVFNEFNTVVEDFRLQRPEYLGGSSIPFDVSVVPQTSNSVEGSPQGSLSAYGQVFGSLRTHYSAREHGILMVLANIRADVVYQGGIRRQWSMATRYDYPHPAFAHLGEQAVFNQEMNYRTDLTPASGEGNLDAWGYTGRYDHLRYFPSFVVGKMRSSDPQSLDSWHLALDYGVSPVKLNQAYLQDNPPIDRVVSVENEPQFYFHHRANYFSIQVMPLFGIPGLRRL